MPRGTLINPLSEGTFAHYDFHQIAATCSLSSGIIHLEYLVVVCRYLFKLIIAHPFMAISWPLQVYVSNLHVSHPSTINWINQYHPPRSTFRFQNTLLHNTFTSVASWYCGLVAFPPTWVVSLIFSPWKINTHRFSLQRTNLILLLIILLTFPFQTHKSCSFGYIKCTSTFSLSLHIIQHQLTICKFIIHSVN
jgi:hypothetical protein